MTIRQSEIGALHLINETTFLTEVASIMSSAFPIPFKRGTCKLVRDDVFGDPMTAKQRLDDMDVQIKLPGKPTLEFDVNLQVPSARNGDGFTAEVGWWGTILDAWLGHTALNGTVDGRSKMGTGTLVTTGTSTVTTALIVNAGVFESGMAVGFATGSGGKLECRVIRTPDTTTSPDELRLKLALSAAPAVGSTVYAAATYALDCGGRTLPTLQAVVQGYDNTERWLLLGGCIDSIVFTLGTRALPSAKVKMKFANMLPADGVSTTLDLTGPLLSRYSYSDITTLVEKDSELRFQTLGTTTLASAPARKFSQLEIKLNTEMVEIPNPSQPLGIGGWIRRNKVPALEVNFTEPRDESTAWETGMNAAVPTVYAGQYQIGASTVTGAWLFDLPTLQVTNVEPLIDSNGISAVKVSMMGRNDEANFPQSTNDEWIDFANDAFRIHMF